MDMREIYGLLSGDRIATGFKPGQNVRARQEPQPLDLFNGLLQPTTRRAPQQPLAGRQAPPRPQGTQPPPQPPQGAPFRLPPGMLGQARSSDGANSVGGLMQQPDPMPNGFSVPGMKPTDWTPKAKIAEGKAEEDEISPWEAALMAPGRLNPEIYKHSARRGSASTPNGLAALMKSMPAPVVGKRNIRMRQPVNSHLRGLLGG